ncbi:TonB-dependent receptor domain-containing protein [Croceibacterium soli]|uniref:TonB-dependent receptor domain-containing protein n=1 Tax=Croceibacterium soli TaxID=1739690 RepID=UPI002E257682
MRSLQTTRNTAFKAVLLAGGAGIVALAQPALAQDVEQEGDPIDAAVVADSSQASTGIVVTGSRIQRQDFQANSPIVTVGEELLQNSSTSSVEVNLNKLPQFTPEKTPTQGGDIQATPTNTPGSATVSLRGIGSNRNLVLIDGRRATPGNASMAVDINTIPSAAIERVEIISGGASSTYGADAVGGVVNFILKKNFEGLEFDAQGGITEHGDGEEYSISGIMGTDFADGRGNISIAMSTAERKPSLRVDRDYFRDVMADPDVGGNYFFPIYSGIQQTGANPQYQEVLNSMFPNRPPNTNVSATGTLYFLGNTPFTFGNSAAGFSGVSNFPESLVDQQLTKRSSLGTLSQNFQEDYINLPLTRYNFYLRGSYEINDWVSVIGQGYFNKSETATVQQPGPIVGGWNVIVPRYANDAEYLPANLVALLNARGATVTRGENETEAAYQARIAQVGCGVGTPDENDFVSGASCAYSPTGYVPGLGNREVFTDQFTYNLLTGFEGNIPGSDWTWDATVQRGESVTNSLTTGTASLERLRAVMSAPRFGAGFSRVGNPTGGGFGANAATCTSGLNPFDPNLVVSQDCIDAIEAPLKETGIMVQTVVEANFQGKAFQLPAGDVRTAFGATYRKNAYEFLEDNLKERDSAFNDQILGIYPARSIDESISSKEVYGEVSVPLIHDTPGIQMLELIGGARYSDSSQTGGSTTWKIEANWEVTDWLRFRGGYNKAERAPNIGELYSFTQNFGLLTGGDACSIGNPFSYSANPANANGAQVRQLCAALMDKTQIPGQPLNSVSFYGNGLSPNDPNYIAPSAGATSTSTAPGFAFPYFVGNPNLEAEKAKTITLGAVIESPFSGIFNAMRLTLDYYNIEVEDAIGLQSGQTLQQLCLDPAFNPTFDPNTFFCNNFARGTGGGIGAVQLAYTNTGAFKTEGIDAQFDWNFEAGPGRVSLNTVFNYLISLKSSPFYSGIPEESRAPFVEYAGTFLSPDSGLSTNGAYRWKTFTTVSYALDRVRVGLQWQHLPAIDSGTTNTGYPAYDLFSLNSSYDVTENVRLRFGIDNLFDKAPPFGNANPNANPAFFQLPGGGLNTNNYDALGRRFFVGANMKF